MESLIDTICSLVTSGRMTPEDASSLLSSAKRPCPIAVIGIACRFPQADTPEEFWQNVTSGRDCITEIPQSRWNKNRSDFKWGGFIEHIDQFANRYFEISDNDAGYMDPQQRIFLEIAHETFERAGYTRKNLNSTDVGVFVGVRAGVNQSSDRDHSYKAMTTGSMANFVPSRVSDFYNLRGPSLAIDTACSSSLVAAHMGFKSLQTGDCSMALVGGVELKINSQSYRHLETIKTLSADGKCHVFDKNANGFVPGEGVGAILLKPLRNALKDGDTVHAVLLNTACNNDGHTMGITSPSLDGQKDVLYKTYTCTGLDPATIQLIEAHGTGTAIGDPIEIKALSEFIQEFSSKKGYCALGSVKSNIGHLDMAAGIAGLVKAILALKHKMIPPTLHCHEPNPRFEFVDSPFFVNDRLRSWESVDSRRRAAVSSFGFGGTNAHVVLEQAPLVSEEEKGCLNNQQIHGLFGISAGSAESLKQLIHDYQHFLASLSHEKFAVVCYSSFVSRDAHAHRIAVCSRNLDELKTKLSAIQKNGIVTQQQEQSVFYGEVKRKSPDIVFMFSGQGEEYPGMAKDLFASDPVFQQAILDCAERVDPHMERPLTDCLFTIDAKSQENAFIAPVISFAIDYALARMWMSWGVRPDYVVGHGWGEYPAACISGMFSLAEGLFMMLNIGRLMMEIEDHGSMAAIFCNTDKVKELLDQLPEEKRPMTAVAAVNGPGNTVISGVPDCIAEIVRRAENENIRSRFLNVSRAFHSPLMTPLSRKYGDMLQGIHFKTSTIPFISTLTAQQRDTVSADYWVKQMVQPVLFYPAIASLCSSKRVVFLEQGPGCTLANVTKEIAGKDAVVLSSLDCGKNEYESVYHTAAQLFTRGVALNPYAERRFLPRIELPVTPMERKTFRINQNVQDDRTVHLTNKHSLVDGCSARSDNKAVYYKHITFDDPLLQHHVIKSKPIMAGMVLLEAVYQAGTDFLKTRITELREILFKTPFQLNEGQTGIIEIHIEKTDTVAFAVQSRVDGDTPQCITHVNGYISTHPLPQIESLDLVPIRLHCTHTISGKTVYDQFRNKAEVDHGPFFRGIKKITYAADQILSQIQIPNDATENEAASNYHHHPGLLDSAIQGLYALTLTKESDQTTHAFIPFFYEKMTFRAALQKSCVAYGKITRSTDEITRFDMTIADSQGQILVEIINGSSKKIPLHVRPYPAGKNTREPRMMHAPETLENLLCCMVCSFTGNTLSDIDHEDGTFLELGMDSEHLVVMVRQLEDIFKIQLYPTVFFEYQTIPELADYLKRTFTAEIHDVLNSNHRHEHYMQNDRQSQKLPNDDSIACSNKKNSNNNRNDVLRSDGSMEISHSSVNNHIAVVGYSVHVPGAENEEMYWENVKNGVDSVDTVPLSRWKWEDYFSPVSGAAGKTYGNRGAFLENIDHFDASFFNISPKEALLLDPKQRLFLQTGWKCLEHAGYCGEHHTRRTGVFVGASYSYYIDNLPLDEKRHPFAATGNGLPLIPNRFSFFMNFNGPSILVDTYCSSSLTALHLACKSLKNNECEMALVGGVHAPLSPDHYITMSQMEALSPDGMCKTFDDNANGYVPGEGVVALLLKPLAQALSDNDTVHAVIIGSAVNHDGHANSITAPSLASQSRVIAQAIHDAGIDGESISFIETHGTGTSIGDPVEFQGLCKAYSTYTNKKSFCALGSVKTNIGHLEPASGLAGLVKIILCLEHKMIPPTLHFNKPNRHMAVIDSPFYINDKLSSWHPHHGVRRAGISSFGLTGTNTHVIVEEAQKAVKQEEKSVFDIPYNVLTLSAKNQQALDRLIADYEEYLARTKDWNLADVCYSANTGRKHFDHRISMVADSKDCLCAQLKNAKNNSGTSSAKDSGFFRGLSNKKNNLVFSFTEIIDDRNNFRELFEKNALFNIHLQKIAEAIGMLADISLTEILDEPAPENIPVKVFAITLALARTAVSLGIKPDSVHGKDRGLFAAKVFSGDVLLEEAIKALIDHTSIVTQKKGTIPLFSAKESNGTTALFLCFGKVSDNSLYPHRTIQFQLFSGDGWKEMVSVLASLHVHGCTVSWKSFYRGHIFKKIPLPVYPFQNKSYWLQNYSPTVRLNEKEGLQNSDIQKNVSASDGTIRWYTKTWRTGAVTGTNSFMPGKVWLLFAESEEIPHHIKMKLTEQKQKVIIVRAAEEFSCIDSHLFHCNTQNPNDYIKLQETVIADFGELYGIIYMWSPPHPHLWIEQSATEIEQSSNRSIYPLFLLLHNMVAQEKNFFLGVAKIFAVATHECIHDADSMRLSPDAAAVSTLLQTAGKELSVTARFIGFHRSDSDYATLAKAIVDEISYAHTYTEVIYKDNQLLVPAIEPFTRDAKDITTPFKEHGVYVITGGLSGIGARVALYCAAHFHARLLLIGRTRLPVSSEWDLWVQEKGTDDSVSKKIQMYKQIKQYSEKSVYFDADVCNREQMQDIMNRAKRKFGSLDGVLHCAGLIDDALIENKYLTSFKNVFAPKVYGTAMLHQVTKDEKLDFFAAFSSLSGVFGNPGQSDYASANACMDSLIGQRAAVCNGTSLSINWPWWREGGMDISPIARKQMESQGLMPLDTDEAVETLQKALIHNGIHNIIIMKQKHDFLPSPETMTRSENEKRAKRISASTIDNSTNNLQKRDIQNFLVTVLKDLLLLPEDEIDADISFEAYGVDSLILKKMVRELERFLDTTVDPSIILEYRTIDSLSDHLAESLPSAALTTHATDKTGSDISSVLDRNTNDIAVIGFSCRFPGAANSDEFWDNLREGVCSIVEVPRNRWDIDAVYDPDPMNPEKTYCRWGGFLNDIDMFDASFFAIKNEDAANFDPQQRLTLEIAWETFEKAGYCRQKISNTPVGVFFGARANHYEGCGKENPAITGYITGQLTNFISARISHFFNLKGPSLTIDTACSSSLVSVHYAVKSLQAHECTMAIAGGCELKITPKPFIYLSTGQALSSTGKSFVFDKNADGFIPGEGVGAVLLKPLADALRDKDCIYAVIKGSSVNNDGHTMGQTTPNMEAQKEVIQKALHHSGVHPETISYIEAHGTGTLIGDPIEAKALTSVYAMSTSKKSYCAVGSVKTNIGHLDTAAGIASFIKVILCLHNKMIPPTLHCNRPNPRFSFVDSPFYPNTKLQSWIPVNGIRRAGISSFGFGGTNCHMIIQEASPVSVDKDTESVQPCSLFTVSAKSRTAFSNLAQRYVQFLSSHQKLHIDDICYTAAVGRDHFSYRSSFLCDNLDHLEKTLTSRDMPVHQVKTAAVPRIVFMFSGQGVFCCGMIRNLYREDTVFSQSFNRCHEILSSYMHKPLTDYLEEKNKNLLTEMSIAQPLTVAIAYSLGNMFMQWGIKPWALLGHGIGEYAAACLAGSVSLEDMLPVVFHRARLMQQVCRKSSMAVLFTDSSTTTALFAPLSSEEKAGAHITAINGPQNTVIAGKTEIVTKIQDLAKSSNIRTCSIDVSYGFHSPMMYPVMENFSHTLQNLSIHTNTIKIFSTVTGDQIPDENTDKEYWLKQMVQPVLFERSIRSAHAQGADIFLELGPDTTLKSMVQSIITDKDTCVCSALNRTIGCGQSLLQCLSELYNRGVNPDFDAVTLLKGKRIALPTYPFERKRYGNVSQNTESSSRSTIVHHNFSPKTDPVLLNHVVNGKPTLPGVCQWDMVFAAGKDIFKNDYLCLQNFVHKATIASTSNKDLTVEIKVAVSDDDTSAFTLSFQNGTDPHWIACSHGKIRINDQPQPQRIDIGTIKTRMTALSVQPSEIYDYYQSAGLSYGDGFRSIERLWGNRDEVLAELTMPETAQQYQSRYTFNPSILDGCLQSIIGFTIMNNDAKGSPFIPFFTEKIAFFKPLPDQCTIYLQLQETVAADLLKCSGYLVDRSGEVLVVIKNINLKQIPRHIDRCIPCVEPKVNDAQSRFSVMPWLYKQEFVVKELPDPIHRSDRSGNTMLIFMYRSDFHEKMCERFKAFDCTLIKAYCGDAFTQINQCEFSLNMQHEKDYESLFDAISKNNTTIQYCIHLWTLEDNGAVACHDVDAVEESLYRGLYSVWFILKNFLKTDRNNAKALYVLSCLSDRYQNDQPVLSPEYSVIAGMFKAVGLEYKHAVMCQLHFDAAYYSPRQIAEYTLNEIDNGNRNDTCVVYRQNRRSIPAVTPLSPAAGPYTQVSLRTGGVYVITGGQGGIGGEIGKYIAQQFHATLILINRTPLPPRTQWKAWLERHSEENELSRRILNIKEMEAAGAQVITVTADVGDLSEMQQCLAPLKTQVREIHGVFHCAGILKDRLFHSMRFEDLKEVVKPKVLGTWIIDHLLSDDELDFVMLFSGAVTIFGAVGQSNYAAANSYLDAYARFRQTGNKRTMVINWWFWGETGFLTHGTVSEKIKNQGLKLLTNHEAILSLEHIRNSGQIQVIMKQPGLYDSDTGHMSHENTETNQHNGKYNDSAFVKSYLADTIQHMTSCAIDEDDFSTSFMDIGLDSIKLVNLAQQLEQENDIQLYPTIFFEYNTINALGDYLFAEHGNQLKRIAVHNENSAYTETIQNDTSTLEKPYLTNTSDNTAYLIEKRPQEQKASSRITNTRGAQVPIPISTDTGNCSQTSSEIIDHAMPHDKKEQMDIAIIGIACQFPHAGNYHQFWQNLIHGVDAITDYPRERKTFLHSDTPDHPNCWGGYLHDIEKFDYSFFNITAAEAAVMDPQQRLFLAAAWEAIEDAGYGAADSLPKKTGVFVGISRQDYQDLMRSERNQQSGYAVIGNTHSMVPSRIAYFLNLHGPALAVNTACSSSLVALHEACKSIRCNECETAIAGGVNLCITPDSIRAFTGMNALSPQGRCKAFARDADGFVSAEGVGVLVVKKLENALHDRDYIYAVIKGSAVNNDGYSNGITAPNPAAQAAVIHQALKTAAVQPQSISYIETHGTGTALGDPVEIEALCTVFHKIKHKSRCAIGSVKTNIGHAETAAGVAGVIKTVLSMQEKTLAPSIHFHQPNRGIDFTKTPFYFNDRPSPWNSDSFPLRAGVSSFGFNGTNAHVILEHVPQRINITNGKETPVLFTLSARTHGELAIFIQKMIDFIATDKKFPLEDICYTANTGKRLMKYRIAVTAESREQIIEILTDACNGLRDNNTEKDHQTYYLTNGSNQKKLVFIFPDTGDGENISDFSAFLYNEPAYAEAVETCEQLLATRSHQKWKAFSHLYAQSRLLEYWGIKPSSVLGFGIGYYAALVNANMLSLHTVCDILLGKSQTMQTNPCTIPVISPHHLLSTRNQDAIPIEPISSAMPYFRPSEEHLRSWGAASYLIIDAQSIRYHSDFSPSLLNEKKDILEFLAWTVGKGFVLNWHNIYASENRKKVPLPTYPFDKKICWFSEIRQRNTNQMNYKKPGTEMENSTVLSEEEEIRDILAEVLKIAPNEIAADSNFSEHGFDSLLMQQMITRLETKYNKPLQAHILYDYPTVESLAAYLSGQDRSAPDSSFAAEMKTPDSLIQRDGSESLDTIVDSFLENELSLSGAQERILDILKGDRCGKTG